MISERVYEKECIINYGWSLVKQKLSFSPESFEEFLYFIEQFSNETSCDYRAICEDGTILNLYFENDSQHLFVDKDDQKITIHKDHVYAMYKRMNLLFEIIQN